MVKDLTFGILFFVQFIIFADLSVLYSYAIVKFNGTILRSVFASYIIGFFDNVMKFLSVSFLMEAYSSHMSMS